MTDAGGSSTGALAAPFEPQPETVDALLAATVRTIEDERSRGSVQGQPGPTLNGDGQGKAAVSFAR